MHARQKVNIGNQPMLSFYGYDFALWPELLRLTSLVKPIHEEQTKD